MPRLIPRDEAFQEIFIKDGENLLEAARALNEMFTAFDRLDERVAEIQALEHAATRSTPRSPSASSARSSPRSTARTSTSSSARLDDVVDGIQEAAETVVIYGIDEATDEARQMAGIIAAQAEQLLAALRMLDHLEGAASHLTQVHDLENKADGLSRSAIGRLFREGGDALRVIKLRDLYIALEETIDAAEDAAEILERIAAKGQ